MIIEFDEYKSKLNALKPALDGLGKALKLDDARAEIASLEAESAKDGFWNDVNNSQKVQKRLKQLQQKVERYERLCAKWDDMMVLCEMAIEENDDSMLDELKSDFAAFETTLEEMRLSTLLSGEYDANNAILTIHPGAGGTEAQDWAQMLYRMYTRWAERHGYTYTLLDWQDGEEAGIKSASIKIEGENAYGYLKSENGVHRLVRLSPFNANNKRQTTFASVFVSPAVDDTIEIVVNPADIEWDTYRRRTNEQREAEKARAAEKLVTSLLPVIDDFERTIDYAEKNGEGELLGGVRAVHSKFVGVLEKDGVEVIDPTGEAFDALEAQAVATVPDTEAFDETVHEVYQKGYRLGAKVIRPAMVTVTTGGPKRPKPEEDETEE